MHRYADSSTTQISLKNDKSTRGIKIAEQVDASDYVLSARSDVSLRKNSMKILLVDNDPVYTNLMSEVLRLHSYMAITAPDGQAALEILKKESVDLVISDISMPRMNGMYLYRSIRSDAQLRTIPFAWNSGYRELRDVVDVENPAIDFKLDKAMPMPSFLYFINSLEARLQQRKQATAESVH